MPSFLIQELIEEGVHCVPRVRRERDKAMRMHAQRASIENDFVYVPEEAHGLPEYIHELTTFLVASSTIRLILPRRHSGGSNRRTPISCSIMNDCTRR